MNDRIALWIGGLVLAAIGLDMVLNEGNVIFFLLKKLLDLVEFVAFWR